MTLASKTQSTSRFIYRFLPILLFAISFRQEPLYTSNQNTYFLHGLANAGVGSLPMDWLSQTADAFPVFSTLVTATIQLLGPNTFYLFYILLLAVYAYSITGIACHIYRIGDSGTEYLSFLAPLTLLHSGALASLASRVPVLSPLTPLLSQHGHLTRGVAEQYILGPVFQPSTFGVFLLLSTYCFLRNAAFWAVLCSAIAATFHPTYLLSAAVLTCTYMVVTFAKEKDTRKALLLGTASLALVAPTLTYVHVLFRPTLPDIAAYARSILVDYRFPHHADVATWFGDSVCIFLVMIASSLYLVRRTTLFPLLLIPFATSAILTMAQFLTGNKTLALLFPWRISAFLMPIALSVILAAIVSAGFRRFDERLSGIAKPLRVALWIGILILGVVGVRHTITNTNAPMAGLTTSSRFVAHTVQPGNLYLVPPDMASFRLGARVPILVDFKSHPYKDTEVVEWFSRIKLAEAFYASSAETACGLLETLSAKYELTHAVLRSDSPIANCPMLREVHRDEDFAVFALQSPR